VTILLKLNNVSLEDFWVTFLAVVTTTTNNVEIVGMTLIKQITVVETVFPLIVATMPITITTITVDMETVITTILETMESEVIYIFTCGNT
jgi:hypothetical protein